MKFARKENILTGGGTVVETTHTLEEYSSVESACIAMEAIFFHNPLAARFEMWKQLNGCAVISVYTRSTTLIVKLKSEVR